MEEDGTSLSLMVLLHFILLLLLLAVYAGVQYEGTSGGWKQQVQYSLTVCSFDQCDLFLLFDCRSYLHFE
jgi:hypothetical protein